MKKKIDKLELKALGIFLPSTGKKAVDTVPQLARLSRENFFEHTENMITDLATTDAIKRDFSFKLSPKKGKVLPETYYGFMYAVKYVIYANVTVDSTHEGTAKIEIQYRNYVSAPSRFFKKIGEIHPKTLIHDHRSKLRT